MTGQIATMVPLIAIVAIGISMVVGVADVLRLPGWAWKRAEEPKVAYVALVGLLPIAGLAMYVVRARPKISAVVAAGRAASLPFERFGDGAPPMDEEQVAEAPEPMHLVAVPAGIATAAAMAPRVTAVASESTGRSEVPVDREPEPEPEGPTEPALVGADSFFSGRGGTATATATRTMHLPASLASRAYHPRQRTSLSETRISSVPAGWKADPTGRHQFRYWNGAQWTENVADAGVQDRDAVCA